MSEAYNPPLGEDVFHSPRERESFDEGFQLGARIEHRVAVEAAANALLDILGKDAGDGIISLGAAGHWARRGNRWEQT